MPKPNLKNPFARRKSSGNILDGEPLNTNPPAQSSFRVIERPEKTKIVLDGPDPRRTSAVQRPFASPLAAIRGKSVDDLTYSAAGTVDTAASRKSAASLQKLARDSAGTVASTSSDFYPSSRTSARHSSTSTLPSSIEPDNEADSDNDLFAQKWAAASKKPLPVLPAPAEDQTQTQTQPHPQQTQPQSSSFYARAQRGLSLGFGKKASLDTSASTISPTTTSNIVKSPTATISPVNASRPTSSTSPSRERALTTSSYASTAVPQTTETPTPDITTSDFGGRFGDMFESLDKPEPVTSPSSVHRTDSPPIYPPKSYSRQSYTPSPHGLKGVPNDIDSPYAHTTRRTSRDGLLDSSAANSPQFGRESQGFFQSSSKPQYSLVSGNTSPNQSKHSSGEYLSASAGTSNFGSTDDIKRYELHDSQDTPVQATRSTVDRNSTVRFSGLPPLAAIGQLTDDLELVDITPKPAKSRPLPVQDNDDDEPLFPVKPGSAARASLAPLQTTQSSSTPIKRLTKAQFDILQKYPDRTTDPVDKADSGDEYDDDDEIERLKQVTLQRRKQEANMALYRQQMKKVTGGGPTDLPTRPSIDRAGTSSASLHLGGASGTPPADTFRPKQQIDEDDDDDIPLAILQAHGFPSGTKAPSRVVDDTSGYRPASIAARNSQSLPPFARRLPEDPYFGASVSSPAMRESMAFGGAGSVYGGLTPGTPGGLVGVIANEERQRQARRGSPNPQTGNMPFARSASMANMPSQFFPGTNMPGMPMMMPQMPATDSAQIQQFMQAQMAMMQNMQNMIQMQQAQINGQLGPQNQQMQPGVQRPMSIMSNSAPQLPNIPQQSRAMSMVGSQSTWNLGATTNRPTSSFDPRMSTYAPSVNGLGAYAPSVAPSERSNVGQPSRYRAVTMSGDADGRTNSLTSSHTLNAFGHQRGNSVGSRPPSQHLQLPKNTIRVVEKAKGAPRSPTVVNDDDEDGNWADMVKKRLKGRRRASKAAEDRVALAELYPNAE